jgi:hypothetical protein
MVVAESDADEPSAFGHDRRSFQLKERVTSSDLSDPHLAAQLIERIGWALSDAEDAERAASRFLALALGHDRRRPASMLAA